MAKRNKVEPRVPKRIAGVKVPRPLRAPAARLLKLADNKLVTDSIAGALVAGAGAVASGKNRRDSAAAATLGASAAAIRAVEGPRRLGVALAIVAAELAVALSGVFEEPRQSKPKQRRKRKKG